LFIGFGSLSSTQ